MVDQIAVSDALFAGAREVFETMIFMSLEELCDADLKIEGDTLLGSITFTGNLEGCLAIYCGINCAKTIAGNMLGMDSSEQISEEELCDAIGEVANMVMGSVKSRLQDSVGDLQVSIPTVVSGRELENSLGQRATSKVLARANIEDEYVAEISILYKENQGSD
ncbi:MAG: chemotaxis protein CheX [Planctomycetota bacterium]|jgi:chemotaxis protein CheX